MARKAALRTEPADEVVSLDREFHKDAVAIPRGKQSWYIVFKVSLPVQWPPLQESGLGVYDSVTYGRFINMGLHGTWVVAVSALWLVSSLVSARRVLEGAAFLEFAGNKSTSSRLLKHREHIAPPV